MSNNSTCSFIVNGTPTSSQQLPPMIVVKLRTLFWRWPSAQLLHFVPLLFKSDSVKLKLGVKPSLLPKTLTLNRIWWNRFKFIDRFKCILACIPPNKVYTHLRRDLFKNRLDSPRYRHSCRRHSAVLFRPLQEQLNELFNNDLPSEL